MQRELTRAARSASAVLQTLQTLRLPTLPALPPGGLGALDAHNSVFGILLQLSEQLASGRWSRLLSHVLAANPLAVLQLWRTQRRHASCARDAAYLGLAAEGGSASSAGAPSAAELRRAAQHAFAAYGALAEALGRHGAGLGDLLRGGLAATQAALEGAAGAEALAYAAAAGLPASALARPPGGARAAPRPPRAAFNPVAYVAHDQGAGWVVLAIRGTLSGHDTLTDACAAPASFPGGHAHAGMAAAAWNVVREHLPDCARLLAQCPGAKLLLTGHSLGGGVAALAAQLCACGDADVDAAAARGAAEGAAGDAARARAACAAVRAAVAVAFACPAVASLRLSLALRPRVTSVVAGKDCVPRLSVAAANRLAWRLAAERLASGERGGGEAGAPRAPAGAHGELPEDAQLWAGGGVEMVDLGRSSTHLLPAGLCLHLRRLGRRGGAAAAGERGPVMHSVHCTAFADIRLGARMLSDHRPSVYARALDALAARERGEAEEGEGEGEGEWLPTFRSAIATATAGTAQEALSMTHGP